jgi:gas vesicle protein
MADENDSSSRLIWFLAGAVVGAVVALLYAPASGKETRRLIRKKSEAGCDALTEAGKEVLEHGKEYYEKGRRIAEDAAGVLERGKKLVSR